ncbi:MAG TPA: GNAT family N-acetyltransferase, partial [Pirellulales bacterium]
VGGRIFIVTADGTPIGGAAFIPLQGDHYELAKMAVAPEYRGRGIGRKLLLHIIAFARSLGARTVRLGSNRKLTNAIHLYESVGFRHLPPERITPSRYTRTNVFMELVLD